MSTATLAAMDHGFNRSRGFKFLFIYTLINMGLVYIAGFGYLRHVLWPSQHLAQIYLITMYLGHLGIAAILFGFLLPAVFLVLLPFRWVVAPAAVFFVTLLFLYLFIDMSVVNNFHFHFNGFFMSMLFSKAGADIFQFTGIEWLWVTVFIALVVLVQVGLAAWLWRRYVSAAKKYFLSWFYRVLLVIVIFICWGVSHVINAWGYANFIPSVVSRSNMLPFYYGLTAHGFLVRHHLIDDEKISQEHNNAYATRHAKLNYPLHQIRIATAPDHRPYNIIFLLIDTWRSDAMTAQISPHIYNFAQHNLQFTNHWSGGDCTQPGIFSLFYGIPASYWQAALDGRQPPAFINTLQRLGYRFAVHGSAELDVPPFNETVFASVKPLQIKTPGDSSWQRDAQINQYMIQTIQRQAALEKGTQHPKPFFAFAFYDAVHGYSYPPNFKLKFVPVWKSMNRMELSNSFNPTPFFNIYKNAVLYDDGLVAKVLLELQRQKMLDHTIVVISSDHGNEFNDNHKNYWGHASNFSPVQMHVPMIIHWPGMGPHKYSYYTSHFDVTPTLMSRALGVQNPSADYSVGKDLFVNKSWPFLVVASYQLSGVVQRDRITTFYRGGYFKKTTPNLNRIDTAMSTLVMRQVFKHMQRYYKH